MTEPVTIRELSATCEPMDEASWQREVIEELQLCRWFVHHVRPGWVAGKFRTQISGDKGFTDVAASRAGRVAFLELKTDKGRLKDGQLEWLNSLAGTDHSAKWWTAKNETPNYVTRGNESGWDVLVAVLRPMHRDWFRTTFLEAVA